MRSQSLWAVHKDSLDFPTHIWWVRRDHEEGMVQQIIEDELLAWCTTMNPRVQKEYFYLWQDLNILYERLSLPWKRIPRPTPSRLGFQLQEPIRMAIDALYFDIGNLWNIRKGNIQNLDALPLEEQVRAYEGGRTSALPWSTHPVDEARLRLVGYEGRAGGPRVPPTTKGEASKEAVSTALYLEGIGNPE